MWKPQQQDIDLYHATENIQRGAGEKSLRIFFKELFLIWSFLGKLHDTRKHLERKKNGLEMSTRWSYTMICFEKFATAS